MTLLASPFEVNGLKLRNRLVMPPMVTNFAAADGTVTEQVIRYYAERAAAGIGLVIIESTPIVSEGRLNLRPIGVWDDAQVPGLAKLVSAIHEAGAKAAIQIVHGGSRMLGGDRPIGVSSMRLSPRPTPRPLTVEEIRQIVSQFASAAVRAKEAGFDAVEVHGAHYYLISQFLSPFTNNRTDEYGGDIVGRSRLAREAIRAVREVVGRDYPVMFRLNGTEMFEGGLSQAEAAEAARLVSSDIDLFDVSGAGSRTVQEDEVGRYSTLISAPPKDSPAGPYVEGAMAVRLSTGKPVIAVGRLADSALAERILEAGQADLIALGRQLLADAEAGRKLLEGRDAEIVRCKECMSCFGAIKKGPVKCAVNRELGA